jgi:hypothetical protein
MYNGKSRHIHHKHNIFKHLPSNGIISINYIKSNENITGLLIKSLLRKLVDNFSR